MLHDHVGFRCSCTLQELGDLSRFGLDEEPTSSTAAIILHGCNVFGLFGCFSFRHLPRSERMGP